MCLQNLTDHLTSTQSNQKDIEVVLICIIHEQVHVWVNYPSKNKENSKENIGETSTLLTEPQKTNLPKPGIMHAWWSYYKIKLIILYLC